MTIFFYSNIFTYKAHMNPVGVRWGGVAWGARSKPEEKPLTLAGQPILNTCSDPLTTSDKHFKTAIHNLAFSKMIINPPSV